MATRQDVEDKVNEMRGQGATVILTHQDMNTGERYVIKIVTTNVPDIRESFTTPDAALVFLNSFEGE